jgi:hypothetical protein
MVQHPEPLPIQYTPTSSVTFPWSRYLRNPSSFKFSFGFHRFSPKAAQLEMASLWVCWVLRAMTVAGLEVAFPILFLRDNPKDMKEVSHKPYRSLWVKIVKSDPMLCGLGTATAGQTLQNNAAVARPMDKNMMQVPDKTIETRKQNTCCANKRRRGQYIGGGREMDEADLFATLIEAL